MQTTVSLKNTEFYAYHGYYPKEKLTGNRFILNLKVSFSKENDQFVNYEHLFAISKDIMLNHEPIDFIETIIEKIMEQILGKYNFLEKIQCEITKVKPPIAQFNGDGTSVQLTWEK